MSDSPSHDVPPDVAAPLPSDEVDDDDDDDDRRPPSDPSLEDRTKRRARSPSLHRPPSSPQILAPPPPPPPPIPPLTTMPLPSHLLPLLLCPVCTPTALLVSPVTLLCGHTVCSRHVLRTDLPQPPLSKKPGQSPAISRPSIQLAPCPLPDCSSHDPDPSHSQPNIPPSSHVSFIPAPLSDSDPAANVHSRLPGLRTDVTVSKLSALIQHAEHEEHEHDRLPTLPLDTDDLTDSDSDSFHSALSDLGHDPRPRLVPSHSRDVESPEPPNPSLRSLPTSPHSHIRHRHPRSSAEGRVPPRKRRRRQQSCTMAHNDLSRPSAERFEKELMAELTCEICLLLMYRPLTTPCQHTFCSKCLERSLDHSDQCPLCRHSLSGFAYQQDQPCNKTVLAILLKAFPDSYAERGRNVEQEEHDERLDTPIFVCQLSFPGMPTLLHFFEPRYRLMLRRCLESPNPCFGMIMPSRPTCHTTGNDYGTMLEIKSVRMLNDGRSMVETWGTHRFRVMERGMLDGYMVGRVERIDDFPNELDGDTDDGGSSSTTPHSTDDDPIARALAVSSRQVTTVASDATPALPPALQATMKDSPDVLLAICHDFLQQLRQGAAPWVVQRLNHTYGPMPSDASNFSFWMAMLLPIDEYEKAKLFPIKSPRLRLCMVVHWIEQLNSNWWFTNGCVIS